MSNYVTMSSTQHYLGLLDMHATNSIQKDMSLIFYL
jgi:hypothetical protein